MTVTRQIARNWLNLTLECFYKLIQQDVNKDNVGKMLQLMKELISLLFERSITRGSITNLQKFKTLNQRWFKATKEAIEKLPEHDILERDYTYEKEGTYYCILIIFTRSYGKRRYEHRVNKNVPSQIHV